MAYETVDFVQETILWDAEAIANSRFDREFPSVALGQIFRADPIQSTRGGLCLSVDEGILSTMTPEEVTHLRKIGFESIQQALVENKEQLVGMVLGEARQGRNYFDRFKVR